MGPVILLDKSALESLSYDEIGFLEKHYFKMVPLILIYEVLGDLSKYENKKNKFPKIASKLFGVGSRINLNYRMLCLSSLLGYYVPMRGKPVVNPGIELTTSNGERGRFIKEPIERKLARRWQQNKYTLVERFISRSWRKTTRTFDMNHYKKEFIKANKNYPRGNSLGSIYASLHNLTMDINNQNFYLNLIINEYNFTQSQQTAIYKRWKNRKNLFLCDFAPYAYYCLQVFLIFHVGLANGLITTRRTNPIDLEYLYYLPFCMVFSSNDEFQLTLGRLLQNKKQDIVPGEVLKKDLAQIREEFYNLDEIKKKKRFYEFGSYPPLDSKSITYQLWKKHVGPWKSGKYGNIKMSKKDEKDLLEKMKPMIDAIKEYERKHKQF